MTSPLERYDNENEARWEVLQDVPQWEIERIMAWVEGVVHRPQLNEWQRTVSKFNPYLFPAIQRKERIMFSELGVDITSWNRIRAALNQLIQSNPERFILILETLVKYVRDSADSDGKIPFNDIKMRSDELLDLLDSFLANGSRWMVVTEKRVRAGLAERANSELTEVAKKLANTDLTDAWNYAYGTEPDAKLAIEKAQNAIEYFATKAGLTKSKTSVYGTLLADIKNNTSKYKSSAFDQFKEQDESHKGEQPDGTLNDMMANWFWHAMNLIQKTNIVRHKNSENHGYVIPVGAARQAVLMATLLCEMIEKEYFKKA